MLLEISSLFADRNSLLEIIDASKLPGAAVDGDPVAGELARSLVRVASCSVVTRLERPAT